MPKVFPVSVHDILKAHNRIKSSVHKTAIITNSTFDEQHERHFFFKAENLQKTGSFKVRGALNAVRFHIVFESLGLWSMASMGPREIGLSFSNKP